MKKKKPAFIKDNKGMSLIDVVVAAAVLTLCVLPICSGFVTVAKGNARIRERDEMRRVLENQVEMVKSSGKFGDKLLSDIISGGEGITEVDTDGNGENDVFTLANASSNISITVISQSEEKKAHYIEFTLTHNMGTPDDPGDDYSLKGVYLP